MWGQQNDKKLENCQGDDWSPGLQSSAARTQLCIQLLRGLPGIFPNSLHTSSINWKTCLFLVRWLQCKAASRRGYGCDGLGEYSLSAPSEEDRPRRAAHQYRTTGMTNAISCFVLHTKRALSSSIGFFNPNEAQTALTCPRLPVSIRRNTKPTQQGNCD